MEATMPVSMTQQLGSLNHITQKQDGLPSPERSGSPELKARSSWQWKQNRLAYVSKQSVQELDEWLDAENTKSEDVLVRYKDGRGNKSLNNRMDPHAWSDLPTDTDEDALENATSCDWNGDHGVISPTSASSKVKFEITEQQPKLVASRGQGGVTTRSEVNVRCFASGDHRWETADIYSAALRKGTNISYSEKKSSSNLPTRAATLQNDPISPCSAEQGDKAFSRIQEADDKCEKPEEVLKSPKSVSGRLIFMESPPRTPRPKAIDKQASMKMSHRYYEIGTNSSRRKVPSRAPSRSSAVDIECGKEDKQRCGRKRKEKSGTVHRSKSQILATNDSAKESTDSSTSLDSDCSDEEDHEGRANDEGVDVEQSIRHMILQKYVMMPGKREKMQSREKQPAEMKQKVRLVKTQASPAKAAFLASDSSKKKCFTSKNLLPLSPANWPPSPHFQGPKKKQDQSKEPINPRKFVSQSTAALQEEQSIVRPPEVTQSDQVITGKNTPTIALKKSWSAGDLHHSQRLGNICALKGNGVIHTETQDPEELMKQETRAVDFKMRIRKDTEISIGEIQAPMTSDQSIFAVKHCCPPLIQEQSNYTNLCIRSMEATLTATAVDLLRAKTLKKANTQEETEIEFPCDFHSHAGLQIARKTAPIEEPLVTNCGMEKAMVAPEYVLCQDCPLVEQGLSNSALLPGPVEISDVKCCKPATNDTSLPPAVRTPYIDDGGDNRDTHRIALLKQANNGGRAEESRYSHESSKAKHRQGAQESRGGFNPVKKVPAVVPYGSCEDDQVLSHVSVTGQPAFHTFLEQPEEPMQKHSADGRRNSVKKQRSIEKKWSTEKPAQQRQEFREATKELQKEKRSLLKRLQELELQHPCNRLKAMSETKTHLTEQDARNLRQEILEQEALIRGYQVENEKAVAKLKEVQLDTKKKLQELAEEKAHLVSQLANRHMQSCYQGWGYGTDSISLNEKLQGALSRESALRIDLQKMQEAYVDLEKLVTKEESSRVADLELEYAALVEKLEAERQIHAQMEGKKQAMIQQEELIASLQETISEQASKIRSLTSRLEGNEEPHGKQYMKEGDINDIMAQQQIETLQNQVKQLETSLRAAEKETDHHSFQVAKSRTEESEALRRLQTELAAVKRHALQRDEEANKILHHLRVENDKLKHESETYIQNLKQKTLLETHSRHTISESELSALNRVKDLEKQVANLRIHYSRKEKEITKKLDEAAKSEVPVGRNNNPGPPPRTATARLQPTVQRKALRELKERIALLEDVLSQKDRTIKNLQKKIQELESTEVGSAACTGAVIHGIEGEKQTRSSTQDAPCYAVQQHQRFQESSDMPRNGTFRHPGVGKSVSPKAASEVAALRRELEKSELTRELLQKTCRESVEKTVLLTLQHQQALQQMHESLPSPRSYPEYQPAMSGRADHRIGIERRNWLTQRSSLEMVNRTLEARLKVISQEIEAAHNMYQKSPRITQILNLKSKVTEMEALQEQKEREWQQMLEETKKASIMEQECAEQRWREALDAKSVEVEKLRLEFNTVLEATMALQQEAKRQNLDT